MKRAVLSLVGFLALASCTSVQVSDSRTQFGAVESAMTAAETLALIYVGLPRCASLQTSVCSSDSVVSTIQQADAGAAFAVQQARKVFADLSASADAQAQALVFAQTAVQALQAVIPAVHGTPAPVKGASI